MKFNKRRARPDATQEDLLSSFVTSQTAANEIGFRFVHTRLWLDENSFFRSSDESYRENVLEKQADLIRYLRERNEQLGRLVLQHKQRGDFQQGISNR